ncbi:MAG TPA: TIGR03619 family F420-dependent LLM class oxidoreductase [Thermomicrobiaceae bacterium]|nr:TIGR03619 family F420-dependent LLM class oxidoreductase [Thermomicrobiaceae bacterium]
MRFGIALPTYPAGATVEGVVDVARAAERLGFVSAWTTDHVIMPPDQAGPYREILEPLMMLAYLAPLVERLTLGISVVVVPQRNGIVLAKELATLDILCRGRLVVGVGAGWNQQEFAMLGYGRRFHHRGAQLDETVAVWQHLWTQPDRPFEGRFYQLPPVAFGPLPTRPGGPPIWVGGSSEAARRRAGRYGAAWHPVGITAEQLVEQAPLVRQAAERAGRAMPEVTPRLPMRIGGEDAGQMLASGRGTLLQGEPAELVERLRAYARAGADEVICGFGLPDGAATVAQMERFQAEVMPHFRES